MKNVALFVFKSQVEFWKFWSYLEYLFEKKNPNITGEKTYNDFQWAESLVKAGDNEQKLKKKRKNLMTSWMFVGFFVFFLSFFFFDCRVVTKLQLWSRTFN